MKYRKDVLAVSILLILITAVLSGAAVAQEKVLHAYSPGNMKWPLEDCANIFQKTHGLQVKLTAGLESKWLPEAKKNADLIFGGTEALLYDFINNNPGFIDSTTRTSLYTRATGILVRKGNPKNIQSLADLTRPGIKILVIDFGGYMGMWEDLTGRLGLIEGIQQNIAVSARNGSDGMSNWKNNPNLDAWISYKPWHVPYKDVTDFVELPKDQRLYRGSSVVVTTISKNKDSARQFIKFLKTNEAHKVFQSWGWE